MQIYKQSEIPYQILSSGEISALYQKIVAKYIKKPSRLPLSYIVRDTPFIIRSIEAVKWICEYCAERELVLIHQSSVLQFDGPENTAKLRAFRLDRGADYIPFIRDSPDYCLTDTAASFLAVWNYESEDLTVLGDATRHLSSDPRYIDYHLQRYGEPPVAVRTDIASVNLVDFLEDFANRKDISIRVLDQDEADAIQHRLLVLSVLC